jgi:hypothetical protein
MSALLSLAAGVGQAENAAVAAKPLRVGIATADITPEGSVWMDGFGFRKKPSEGVCQPLGASCVVFDNEVTRLAFVALDLCRIGETPQLADLKAAAQKAGIPPQHLMVNCSHTHSGPAINHKDSAAYTALFKRRTDALFAAATADLQPAVLHYTVGSSTMGVNRRRVDEKGRYAGFLPEPRKPIDPDVPILRISSPEGKIRAVLFGYACHPSTMADYRFSPDYVGYARDWIAAAYPGCVPVFLQGCGADIKTRYTLANGRFGCVMLTPEALTAELGHEIGRAVVVALAVPPGRVPATTPKAMQEVVNTPIYLGGIVEEITVPDKKQPDSKSHRIYTGAWRVGDVYFFGSQCEIGSQIGLRIKRELAGKRVWTNGYTHWGIGYILDAASYPEGGYEIDNSSVSPATEAILVGTAIRYVRTLETGRTGPAPIPKPAAERKERLR